MPMARKSKDQRREQSKTPPPFLARVGIKLDPTQQREILGVVLFAFAGLTLLSLSHVTPSVFTDAWANVLRLLFGWGAFALPILAGIAGAFLLRRGKTGEPHVAWGRIFAAEIFFAVALGFVHLLTPIKPATPTAPAVLPVEVGEGGGFIGWAISRALASVIGNLGAGIVLALIGILTLPAIIGLKSTHLNDWSESLADRAASAQSESKSARARAETKLKSGNGSTPDAVPSNATLVPPPVSNPKQIPLPDPAAVRPRPTLKPMLKPAPSIILTPRNRPRPRGPQLPSIELLDASNESKYGEVDAKRKGDVIIETLANFGIPAKIVEVNAGPTITQFGLEPGFVERRTSDGQMRPRKVSVNRIAALQHDLELALAAAPLRIETPVPGRPIVGIEVPNQSISVVSLRGIMETDKFKKKKSRLKVALGRDVSGEGITAALDAMPHLLIAGATGSGKSVCINAIIACLLFDNSPDDLRLIMVDPKRVELVNFNGIPHLLGPVVTNAEEVVSCLRWVTREMDSRFTLFAKERVRNIEAFNEKMTKSNGEHTMPYIIVLIDELADLMLSAPEETEKQLTRLAQMARATGIHLVIATQRPSVDVVTGLIKANFPSRISFAVTSSVDSRVVLDTPGAEKLLGKGDMLYMANDSAKLFRLQGCFVSDDELARLVHFWREKAITDMSQVATEAPWKNTGDAKEGSDDALIVQATTLVQQYDRTSISFLQRKLGIGYPRAARLMDQLEEHGIVGPDEGGGKSRVVIVAGEQVKNFEAEEPPKKKR